MTTPSDAAYRQAVKEYRASYAKTWIEDRAREIDALRSATDAPDKDCITDGSGLCVATGPCMHGPAVDAGEGEPLGYIHEVVWPDGTSHKFCRKVPTMMTDIEKRDGIECHHVSERYWAIYEPAQPTPPAVEGDNCPFCGRWGKHYGEENCPERPQATPPAVEGELSKLVNLWRTKEVSIAPGVCVPLWLVQSAANIELWMKLNNHTDWKLGGIQSRVDRATATRTQLDDWTDRLLDKANEVRAMGMKYGVHSFHDVATMLIELRREALTNRST